MRGSETITANGEVAGSLRAAPGETTASAPRPTVERHGAVADQSTERRAAWNDALRRRMLAVADIAAVLAAAIAAGLVETGGLATAIWSAALLPLWLVVAKARGLYDADHVRIRHDTIGELSGLFHWATLSTAATALALAVLPGSLLSSGGAIAMWLAAFGAAVVLRAGARAAWRRLVPPERGLVVGQGDLADAFARKLVLEPGHHLSLAGRVALHEEAPDHGGHPVDGAIHPDELPRVVRELGIERIIVALQDLEEHTLARVISTCRSRGVKLSVAPPLHAMLGTATELSHLAELPLVEFRTWDASRSTMFGKRLLDVVVASLALVLLSPLLFILAAAILLDSRGSVLFRQPRAGQAGVPFRMLKFRTMVRDAEARLDEILCVDELAEPMFKLRRDPRVTRVGRLLRRWSLDEVPQLLNVIRGEMSLVGPRPEELRLAERYGEAERFRLSLKPGITGPMQVHGRGELTFAERLAVEREYVENYSLRKDVQILCRTVPAVLRGRGAF
jgi:exopolysaccharide biosynthesis polyprenyl glycosylphosphotransferase